MIVFLLLPQCSIEWTKSFSCSSHRACRSLTRCLLTRALNVISYFLIFLNQRERNIERLTAWQQSISRYHKNYHQNFVRTISSLISALPGSSIGRRECKEGAGEMEVFKNARCVAPWMKYYSRTACCRVTMLSCPGPPASEAISLVQLCVSATWGKFIAPDSWPPLPPEGSSNVKNVGEVNLSVACGLHVQSEGWRRRPCRGRQ